MSSSIYSEEDSFYVPDAIFTSWEGQKELDDSCVTFVGDASLSPEDFRALQATMAALENNSKSVPKMPRRRPSLALSPCPNTPPSYRGNSKRNLRTITPSSGSGHKCLPRIPRRRSTIQCPTDKDASVSPMAETTVDSCSQDSSLPKAPVHWPTVVGKYMELDDSAHDSQSILTEDDAMDMTNTNTFFCPTSRPMPTPTQRKLPSRCRGGHPNSKTTPASSAPLPLNRLLALTR